MVKAAKQPTTKQPTAKEIFDGVKLLELNPRGQYLFVLNEEQFNMNAVADLINLCDNTAMTNVKGALLVKGDVNTAVKLIDVKDLKKENTENAKANTTK
jgi:hypothetical protein